MHSIQKHWEAVGGADTAALVGIKQDWPDTKYTEKMQPKEGAPTGL